MALLAIAGFAVGFLLSFRAVRGFLCCVATYCFLCADPLSPGIWLGFAAFAVTFAWKLRTGRI